MRATLALLASTAVVFGLQLIAPGITDELGLTPARALAGAWWQFITYAFVHGGTIHLFLNLFALLMFGPGVERSLGWKGFVLLYVLSGLGSAALHIFLAGASDTLLIGASGAVFGILTAYGFLFPRNWVIIYPGIPLPGILAVAAFAGIELFLGLTGAQPGIANFGHLGGIVTGLVFMLLYRLSRSRIPIGERESQPGDPLWE